MAVIFIVFFSQSFCDCIFDGFLSIASGKGDQPVTNCSASNISGAAAIRRAFFHIAQPGRVVCMLRQWLRLPS